MVSCECSSAAPPATVILLALDERLEDAAYFTGHIQRDPYLSNSRWYAVVALEPLTARLAPLPAEVRSVAEEGGRAGELPEMTAELLALLG